MGQNGDDRENTPALGVDLLARSRDLGAARPVSEDGRKFVEDLAYKIVEKMVLRPEAGKITGQTPAIPPAVRGLKMIGLVTGVILTVASVGWTAAVLVANKVDRTEIKAVIEENEASHDAAIERIEVLEKNDIRQTTILEAIEKKLDRALPRLERARSPGSEDR